MQFAKLKNAVSFKSLNFMLASVRYANGMTYKIKCIIACIYTQVMESYIFKHFTPKAKISQKTLLMIIWIFTGRVYMTALLEYINLYKLSRGLNANFIYFHSAVPYTIIHVFYPATLTVLNGVLGSSSLNFTGWFLNPLDS